MIESKENQPPKISLAEIEKSPSPARTYLAVNKIGQKERFLQYLIVRRDDIDEALVDNGRNDKDSLKPKDLFITNDVPVENVIPDEFFINKYTKNPIDPVPLEGESSPAMVSMKEFKRARYVSFCPPLDERDQIIYNIQAEVKTLGKAPVFLCTLHQVMHPYKNIPIDSKFSFVKK